MGAVKHNIFGSDYVGAFITASDRNVFIGANLPHRDRLLATEALGVEPVALSVFGTDLVGLFARANSNGIVLSGIAEEGGIKALKDSGLGLNIAVIGSGLNAIGNNILVNDRIAVVNPEYDNRSIQEIRDAFGVEVVKQEIGGFKTLGANNILTNRGLVINNRATDQQKERVDGLVGFDSERSTANTGSLSVGLSVVANSKGLLLGDNTTGYEMARIMNALGVNE